MTAQGKTNFFSQAWLVLVLAICFGGLLAGMQIALGPTIEANKINETLERVPELVFGAAHANLVFATNTVLDGPLYVERVALFNAKQRSLRENMRRNFQGFGR